MTLLRRRQSSSVDESARCSPRSRADPVHRRCGAAAAPGAVDRRGDRPRARALPIHPGPRGPRARSQARGVLRRAPRGDMREWNRCAGPGADGARDRTRRRSDLPEFYFHRDCRGRRAGRRHAGVRRRGRKELQSGSRKPAAGVRRGVRGRASSESCHTGRPFRAARGLRPHYADRGGGKSFRPR